MTENQEKEMFNLLTKSVGGIQELNTRFDSLDKKVDSLDKKVEVLQNDVSEMKQDVSELKSDVSELKSDVSELKSDVSELSIGQKRIEKEIRLNNRAVNTLAGGQIRLGERVLDLEKASV